MILITTITAFLFSLAGLLQKIVFAKFGFTITVIRSPFFWLSLLAGALGLLVQFYALTKYPLAQTFILIAVGVVTLSALLGTLLLKEQLTFLNWFGIILAIGAVILLQWK